MQNRKCWRSSAVGINGGDGLPCVRHIWMWGDYMRNSVARQALRCLALGVITIAVWASRPTPAAACVDLISCVSDCQFAWVQCNSFCDSLPPDQAASCYNGCDSRESGCETTCFWNACS
jgi:hypothetical protein